MANTEWNEMATHVLKELERLADGQERIERQLKDVEVALRAELNTIKVEIATLKVKSGLWGLAGAGIPIAILLGVEFLKR